MDPLTIVDDDFIGGYFEESESESNSADKNKVPSTTKAPLQRRPVQPVEKVQNKPAVKQKLSPKPNRNPLIEKTSAKPSTTLTSIPPKTIKSGGTINCTTPSENLTMLHKKVLNTMLISVSDGTNNKSETSDESSESDSSKSDESNESSDDEDPISEVVSKVVGESDEKTTNEKIITVTTEDQSKELMDDVVDGVVDTLAGEESAETSAKSGDGR